jgi:hypothetical protein
MSRLKNPIHLFGMIGVMVVVCTTSSLLVVKITGIALEKLKMPARRWGDQSIQPLACGLTFSQRMVIREEAPSLDEHLQTLSSQEELLTFLRTFGDEPTKQLILSMVYEAQLRPYRDELEKAKIDWKTATQEAKKLLPRARTLQNRSTLTHDERDLLSLIEHVDLFPWYPQDYDKRENAFLTQLKFEFRQTESGDFLLVVDTSEKSNTNKWTKMTEKLREFIRIVVRHSDLNPD